MPQCNAGFTTRWSKVWSSSAKLGPEDHQSGYLGLYPATICQDIVILLLEGDKLGCDQLQFGFQSKASTTLCSWVATAIVDHYNRQGFSGIWVCNAMDLSKAFD